LKTLLEVYKWQIAVVVFAGYIVLEKGSWLNQMYQTNILFQPRQIVETTVIVVVAGLISIYVMYTIWSENQKPVSTRKQS